jgi:hypothetical protein
VTEEHEHALEMVLPFVVVKSKGGPYDDDAFVAGYQCGLIDKQLEIAAATNAQGVLEPIVRRALLPQLELHGMRHGFPVLKVGDANGGNPDLAEWCWVSFLREES